jgi:hypothetical protein
MMERYQNMTINVGWKRGNSKEARATFIASAAVQWSAHREGLGDGGGRFGWDIMEKSKPSNLYPHRRSAVGAVGDEL